MKESLAVPRFAIQALSGVVGLVMLSCVYWSSIPLASIISVLVLIGFLAYVALVYPLFAMKYLPFHFAVLANVLGCVPLEFGSIYVSEVRASAHFVGSIPLLVASRWLFELVLLFVDRIDSQIETDRDAGGSKTRQVHPGSLASCHLLVWLSIGFSVCCAVMLLVVREHSAASLGLDRFEYGTLYLTGITRTVTRFLGIAVVIPLLSIRNGKYLLGGTAIALYVLYQVWIGAKFGEFFALLSLACIVFYPKVRAWSKKRLRRSLISLVCGFLVLVGVSSVIQLGYSDTDPRQFLSVRMAQQGQLWWRTYEVTDGGRQDLLERVSLGDVLRSDDTDIAGKVGSNEGIYGVMYLVTPSYVVDSKLSSGSRYTEGGYAAALVGFGVPGVFVYSLVMAVVCGGLTSVLTRAVSGDRLVISIFLIRLSEVSRVALSMFLFGGFFSKWALVAYTLMVMYALEATTFRGARSCPLDSNVVEPRPSDA